MPTVTIPTIADGDAIEAETVNLMFNAPTSLTASLSVINGQLDYANITNDLVISAEHMQRGSSVRGMGVAGTANLDWRWTWFGDYQSVAVGLFDVETDDPLQYIPGACQEFYMPWDGVAVVMWTIFWFNDHYSTNGPRSDIVLMMDGLWQNQRRACVWGGNSASDPTGYKTHRSWSGHACIDADKGWHNIGLALLADSRFRNTRIYACSMVVLRFKLT